MNAVTHSINTLNSLPKTGVNYIEVEKTGDESCLLVKTSADVAHFYKLLEDEVLIEVHYTGISLMDTMLRIGFAPNRLEKPFVPGYEISGIILKVGPKVKHLKVGDSIFALIKSGGCSSLVKTSEFHVRKLPSHLTLAEGAALPLPFVLAYNGLVSAGRVRKGDKVLIDFGASAAGILAYQILQQLGATAYGLTSTASKKTIIESYGAIAYTLEEFSKNKTIKDFDLILNSRGGNSVREHFKRLGLYGRVLAVNVSEGFTNSFALTLLKLFKTVITLPIYHILYLINENKGIQGFGTSQTAKDVTAMAKIMQSFDAVETMQLKPRVDKIFSYQQIQEVHHYIASRKAVGRPLIAWQHPV